VGRSSATFVLPIFVSPAKSILVWLRFCALPVAEVLELPADSRTGLDSLYAHDPVLIADSGAIIFQMGKSARRGEGPSYADSLKRLGRSDTRCRGRRRHRRGRRHDLARPGARCWSVAAFGRMVRVLHALTALLKTERSAGYSGPSAVLQRSSGCSASDVVHESCR